MRVSATLFCVLTRWLCGLHMPLMCRVELTLGCGVPLWRPTPTACPPTHLTSHHGCHSSTPHHTPAAVATATAAAVWAELAAAAVRAVLAAAAVTAGYRVCLPHSLPPPGGSHKPPQVHQTHSRNNTLSSSRCRSHRSNINHNSSSSSRAQSQVQAPPAAVERVTTPSQWSWEVPLATAGSQPAVCCCGGQWGQGDSLSLCQGSNRWRWGSQLGLTPL